MNLLRLVFIIIILAIGLVGNLIGLYALLRYKIKKKFPSYVFYVSLAIFDTVNLIILVTIEFLNNFNVGDSSVLACKIIKFLEFSVEGNSSWILVCISVERLILIKFNRCNIFKELRSKLIAILIILVSNIVLYSPIIHYATLEFNNDTLSDLCTISNTDGFRKINSYIDLFNSTVIPFVMMTVCSIFLCYMIFKSRLNITNLKNAKDRNRLRKDIKFSISSLIQNVIFICLAMPMCIIDFGLFDFLSVAVYFIFVLEFCVNFYILFVFNSIFRNQVLYVFGFSRNKN